MNAKYLLLTIKSLFLVAALQAQKTVNQKPSCGSVKTLRLSSTINSASADFAPTRYGDRIYFTSMTKKTDGSTSSKIYSFMEGGEKSEVKDLSMKRKSSHIAHIAFMPDASRMYFTICQDDNQDKCTLWYRDKEYEGGWSVAKKLPEIINQRGTTTTMPSVGWDEEQKKFALFFVSDRAGGAGGKDIWVSHIRFDGEFGTPYPLTVNTAADEITPYFDRNAQRLYFSTNGRKGQGRFDIYVSEKIGDMWSRPENMGRPYNSGYDDLYFTLHEISGTAYFSSDRPGSLCKSGDTDGWHCYDLYEVLGHENSFMPMQKYRLEQMAMQYIEN